MSDIVDLDDLYDRYVDFEERFLEFSIQATRVHWVREYYRKTFRLLTMPTFRSRWFKWPERRRTYEQAKWLGGFDAWLAKEKARDEELREQGCPPNIERLVRESIERLRQLDNPDLPEE